MAVVEVAGVEPASEKGSHKPNYTLKLIIPGTSSRHNPKVAGNPRPMRLLLW